ncbi:MAG: OsmC family protein [Bacteriovorax sp.]|nr:OsmC family protein [Bacteriovorax sp.]
MITAKRAAGLTAEIKVREHSLFSGVADGLGGHDEGLNPHELLEGALAACTIITVQMYANRKNMKLESTDVAIKITAEGTETRISRDIKFNGDLTLEEHARLLEIADKCPIHRLLESHIKIDTNAL